MEVMPGYKQTEVGVIPEDWEVCRVRELVKHGPKNGYSGRSGKDVKGTPTLSLSATSTGRLVLDSQTIKYLEERISPDSDLFLEPGDILVQRSNTIDLVGTTAIFTGTTATFIYPDLMMRLRFKEPASANWFWRYANSSSGRRFFKSVAAGSTGSMPKISGEKLREMPVPAPPLPEQEAIAEALSDADALIESLEQLIAKKHQIKQGAMQELLCPKVGWSAKKLLYIAPLQRGFDLPNRLLKKGRHPVVYSNGILNYHEHFMVRGPGLVTGRSGTLGVVQFITEDFWPHNTTLWVTDFKGNDPKFIFYLYSQLGLERFGTGSGVPTLNRNDVHDFSASIPNDLTEQVRIASILTDMDTEIAALEAKLAKYRQIKQGMMHALLTGRIRLI